MSDKFVTYIEHTQSGRQVWTDGTTQKELVDNAKYAFGITPPRYPVPVVIP